MSSAPLVVSALAALLVGPFFALFWSRGRAWRAVIDGLSLALVGGLCLLVLVPHAMDMAGIWAVGAAVLGALTPGWSHRLSARWERTFVYAGLALLAVHAAVDGAALVVPGGSMALAVVAHRLPMGLAVYSAASRAASGPRAGFAALGVLLMATLVGVAVGAPLTHLGSPEAHGLFEAFVAGLLMHIVFEHAPVFPAPETPDLLGHHSHAHGHDHGHGSARAAARAGGRRWSALGAVVGIVLVGVFIGVEPAHDHAHSDGPEFLEVVVELVQATALPLLLGYLVAGVWTGLMPSPAMASLRSPSRVGRVVRGLGFGLSRPLCACGVVPLHEQVMRRGAPVAGAMAFLVAGPALDVASLVVSVPLLGVPLTLVRVVAAVVTALVVGLVFRAATGRPDTLADSPEPRGGLRAGLAFGLGDLVDHTLPWVALGVVVAGMGAVGLAHSGLGQLPGGVQVPLLAVIGVPMYVCATGATPAAAALVEHGLAPGAVIALLVAGPAINLPALAVVRSLLGRRAVWWVVAAVTLTATGAGWLLEVVGPPALPTTPTDGIVVRFAWVGLAVLALRSLFRQGARGIVAQIVEPVEVRSAGHSEAPAHTH